MLAELLGGERKPTGAWDSWFLIEIYAVLNLLIWRHRVNCAV